MSDERSNHTTAVVRMLTEPMNAFVHAFHPCEECQFRPVHLTYPHFIRERRF